MTFLALLAVLINPGDMQSKRKPSASCLVFGTVFNEAGFLVRGAKVEIKAKTGKGHWEASSDVQGEFAVHLPASKAVYTVEASAPGLEPDRKEAECSGDERVDVVLHLKKR